MKIKGDTLFTIGGITVVGSLVGYLGALIVGLTSFFANEPADADAMALGLLGFLIGLAIMGAGWLLCEWERQKGTSQCSSNRRVD